jgi:hypothetical protein
MTEKRPVIIGENRPNSYSPTMTKSGALRYARRIMPKDLVRAGFSASIFASDPELHGGLWWRVNYSK